MVNLYSCGLLLSALLVGGAQAISVPGGAPVEALLGMIGIKDTKDQAEFIERLNPLDALLFDIMPIFFGQASSNVNGSLVEFKDYIMNDVSNDDLSHLTGQEMINRAGFEYETYDAVADDGYITVLTRIVNPLADKRYLRYPPILIEHGGTIDPTAYIIASTIQHHPEKWPREPGDAPMTSSNRSLAFVLSNNGFDVWLAETRGANDHNNRRIKTKAAQTVTSGGNTGKNLTVGENIDMIFRGSDFWSFSIDDIIAHELKSHIDTVLKHTGAHKLHLMTFSLSTPSSLSFLSTRKDYAKKIEGFVSMAPITSGEGLNFLVQLVMRGVCPMVPDKIGTLVVTDVLFSAPTRELILLLSHFKWFRYTFVKAVITLLLGPSAKYRSLLDLNVMGHMLRRLSFKEAKQLCQQMKSNRLQKFDYGPIKNMLIYNSTKPPIYDLSDLHIKDWILIAADNDALATNENRAHLLSLVNPKPTAVIMVPGFNHLDLIAGMDNDKLVNLPIKDYYVRRSTTPLDPKGENGEYMAESRGRALDFVSMLPPELSIITDTASSLSRSGFNMSSQLAPNELIKRVKKDIEDTLNGVVKALKSGKNPDAYLEEHGY